MAPQDVILLGRRIGLCSRPVSDSENTEAKMFDEISFFALRILSIVFGVFLHIMDHFIKVQAEACGRG